MKTKTFHLLACVVTLTLLTSTALTQNELRYPELPNFHKVNTVLFRGGQPKPEGFQVLKQLGVKTIINLRDDDKRAREEGVLAQGEGFRYLNIPLGRWGRPDDKEVEQVLSLINNPENQPVFVHCAHGADRTGVVIAAYRISHDGWNSEQAKAEAKRYGLKPWQLGMKDYIRDYYKRRAHEGPR